MDDDGWETASSHSGVSSLGAPDLDDLAVAVEAAAVATALADGKVFVALPEEFRAGKNTLDWPLKHLSKGATIVLTHVHVTPQMIPMMGTKFHASLLAPGQVQAHRQLERKKVEKCLDKHLFRCSRLKVSAKKLVLEMDDVAEGLLELITLHGITKLVMGAAADRHYMKRMMAPKSKTACEVMQKADPSCKIWFIYKGDLICTRETCMDMPLRAPSAAASPTLGSHLSEQLRSFSLPRGLSELFDTNGSTRADAHKKWSRSDITTPHIGAVIHIVPQQHKEGNKGCRNGSWEGVFRRCFSNSLQEVSLLTNEVRSNPDSYSLPREEEYEVRSIVLPSIHESDEDLHCLSPHHELGHMQLDADVYDKLEEAILDAEVTRKNAYEESRRHQKAEADLLEARQNVKRLEELYKKEEKQKNEFQETLARERQETQLLKQVVDMLKQEMELLKKQRDENFGKFEGANAQISVLERRIADSDQALKEVVADLSEARHLLDLQKAECEQLQHERDNAFIEAEELRNQRAQLESYYKVALNLEFSLKELEQATQGFNDHLKIGEGGYGCVYKGVLRGTTVAVKMLRTQTVHGQSEFLQEVMVLSRVRHPNLVILVGACKEASCLVYEFLPNGSLEDCLNCKGNSPPLTWQVRTRIIGEICSALVFLHKNKPHPVVHGDLKPANILLDANLVSKLSDFGVSHLLVEYSMATSRQYRTMNPRGTIGYMDPEFLGTGVLTPQSDVYSFGIVILRLLTGKPPMDIAKQVEDALEMDDLLSIIDSSAGNWPLGQAKQLAYLGIRCVEKRRMRPDLESEVWRVVAPMMKAASLSPSSLSFGCL